MYSEEDHEHLGPAGLEEEGEGKQMHAAVLPQALGTNFGRWGAARWSNLSTTWGYRRVLRCLYLGFALCILAFSVHLFQRQAKSSITEIWPTLKKTSNVPNALESPFTGAFARFPRISALPKRQRRMTIIGVWNGDSFPSYLRHFFYTMQLNADVLDLVMINRVQTPESGCMDFEKAGINITWGGNIKFHCMDDKEWKRRHVDFLCSSKYGWNCNSIEYEEVTKEYQTRPDKKNFTWRPLRGYVFRDLFINPDNPFWAWMDHDLLLGNFARYPFNILSQLSLLTGSSNIPEYLYLAGQLTAFNLDDEALGTAWKKFPAMKSAGHFTKYIDGKMPESTEERYWSLGYLRSDEDLPGADLSYGVYPDIHGDDYYDGGWNLKNVTQTYLVSGRDILLVSTSYTRKEIEFLIQVERNDPVDDLGGIGWTGGEDGSAYLLDQPTLSSSEAKLLAINNAEGAYQSLGVHDGIVDDAPILKCAPLPNGGWQPSQKVTPHPLTVSNPPVMRASLIHFKEQQAGHILRRLEKDQRPRGYERKLLKHHLRAKKMSWFEFPPFDITEDLVLRYNNDGIEVFKMGPSRDQTLFYRKEGEKSVG